MTLQELAQEEDQLYFIVISLTNQHQTSEIEKQWKTVFMAYKDVHKKYAELSCFDVEALKRGLFIQWYALTEPWFTTGISDIEQEAAEKVMQNLNRLISTNNSDSELIWMLNYYNNWDWIFKLNKSFQGFDRNIVNELNNRLPDKIDSVKMKLRGQMGRYWNSLTKFDKI